MAQIEGITINITGGTYIDSSRAVSSQVTRNFLPKLIDNPFVKSKYVLEGFPGLTLFGTAGTSPLARGTVVFNNSLYRVYGTTLYLVGPTGAHTSLGTIPGSEQCIFDSINTQLVIVTERRAFVYNSDTGDITEVSDSDLESPDSCTALNNQIIYDGDKDRFGVSDVGDPLTINGLNYATAESRSDDLIRVYAYKGIVQMLGQTTIEQWVNTGVGKPPFDKVEGGVIEIGLGALFGVASTLNSAYIFGSDKRIYALDGTAIQEISDDALVALIESFTRTDDARMFSIDFKDRKLVGIVFPTANKSFLRPEGEGGQWFEWSSGVNGGRTIANSCVKVYGKNIIEDYRNGNLLYLDINNFTENGETIVRQRDTAPFDGESFGFSGKTITMNKLVLNVQAGVGLISGQGSDPKIMLSWSDDGGQTFSTEVWAKIGKMGDFKHKAIFTGLGSFTSRILRFRCSDPVFWSIRDATVDIEVGI